MPRPLEMFNQLLEERAKLWGRLAIASDALTDIQVGSKPAKEMRRIAADALVYIKSSVSLRHDLVTEILEMCKAETDIKVLTAKIRERFLEE